MTGFMTGMTLKDLDIRHPRPSLKINNQTTLVKTNIITNKISWKLQEKEKEKKEPTKVGVGGVPSSIDLPSLFCAIGNRFPFLAGLPAHMLPDYDLEEARIQLSATSPSSCKDIRPISSTAVKLFWKIAILLLHIEWGPFVWRFMDVGLSNKGNEKLNVIEWGQLFLSGDLWDEIGIVQ
ncbi:hypothetical protein CEXT_797081 [Caerostris extrusa]|uniref:Uncharacterized protein n=1 Tax=Caerostris extrusa TaxID=172846 RepID=A0AAV4XFH8_CAEEX|nr:hypothetical protein CEXT_797081 [Caerostris extrusa]